MNLRLRLFAVGIRVVAYFRYKRDILHLLLKKLLITKSQKTTIQLNSLNYQVAYRKDSAGNNFERFSFTNGYQDQIGRESREKYSLLPRPIIISINWRALYDDPEQKICKFFFDDLRAIFYRFSYVLSQVAPKPYRSQLPDFLLGIIDQFMKADQYHALSYDFLHEPLEQLIYKDQDPPDVLWLFVGPTSSSEILSHKPHALFPLSQTRAPPSSQQLISSLIIQGQLSFRKLFCTNILANQLQNGQLEDLQRIRLISIDQVRARCEANLYTSHKHLELDLKMIISWNQAFRAASLKTFAYLSFLYEKLIIILTKKDLAKRFYQIKQNDLAKLMKEEQIFKVSPKVWPLVPTSFRQYQQIDHYVPTPAKREPQINHRIQSKKEPVQCPSDCVCLVENLPEGEDFCRFSLLNGWETNCPNRARKIECNHINEQDMKRCRNSQIRKHKRKRCVGKLANSQGQESQIQERLTWGIDLHTRNVLYHCLPEKDIDGAYDLVNNNARKSYFIERTLTKAMNFLGGEGYNLVQTCNYIKRHADYPLEKEESETKMEGQAKLQGESNDKLIEQLKITVLKEEQINFQKLFSKRDYQYADILIKNFEIAFDKTSFRIHTKGKGAICIDRNGIKQGSFIVEYFGEIYEPWRWYDREDFIKQIMKKKKLKNYIPQFYNIVLEKHPDQPLGYDMLVVDPSRKGNFSSRFSHSCDPNCGTVITVSEGKYYIGMYSFRDIEYGEQLTFDYCSMTESNYEHLNSICLCGMQKCRGNYLQLSTAKIFNNLMDNKNCFFTRNSTILKSAGEVTTMELDICASKNIKQGFLQDTPAWLIKWMARVLTFIDEQAEVYKQGLIESWRKNYPWDNNQSESEKEKNIELYSHTNKQDLIIIRFQNLITSVDKLKYFFSNNVANQRPPIFVEQPDRIVSVLITKEDSVLKELQQNIIKYKCTHLAQIIQEFLKEIQRTEGLPQKLFLFRLCCLLVSHQLLFLQQPDFSYELLSDIVYFYAFTHTYFSPNEYDPFNADEIAVAVSEITGERVHANERKEKSKKKYASPFVWGQLASWYKQTIVCPEASLSQDRRGTLSYPIIKSIMKSDYPYEKQSRSAFHRILQDKPANSWPPAAGCDLSFKNPYKLYGTLLFENIHSKEKLAANLPMNSLLESCLNIVNYSFRHKLQLFMKVEMLLQNIPNDSVFYKILNRWQLDLDSNVPLTVRNSSQSIGEPKKRVKRDSSTTP